MVAGPMPILCRFFGLAALLATLSGPASAFGEAYYTSDKVYDNKGPWWTISVNIARKSCLIHTTYEDGTIIEVGGGHSQGQLTYFFMFGNASWAFKENGRYGVVTEYDQPGTWKGDGVGVKVTDYKGVAIEGLNEKAVEQFAGSTQFNLEIGGRNYGNYVLPNTQKKLAKMRECIVAVEDGRIPLPAVAERKGADVTWPPSPPPPLVPLPTPTPSEEDIEDGAAGGKGTAPVLSYGSGFFVNANGYLLTNAHVVRHCGDITLRIGASRKESAMTVAGDEANDLALLKIRGKIWPFAKFRGAPPIRLGESVVVSGYLTGYPANIRTLSTGLVDSFSGVGDNKTKMQISAPVQSNNSGAPVVDQSLHVVGVVVAESNTKDSAEVLQNANFAIKADVAMAFLDRLGVPYEVEPPGTDWRKMSDVAEIAHAFSAQVICEVTEPD